MIDQFHMWASFLVIFFAMAAYATERISIEITSLLVLVALLLLFSLIPYLDAEGTRLLDSGDILAGFGNPALITIMALLVMAQGLFQSGALERIIAGVAARHTACRYCHYRASYRRHAVFRFSQ
jgi:di/tricarboxylate transporter